MVTGLSQEPSSLLKTQKVVLSPPSPSNQKDIKKGLKDWKKRCHWIFYIISCVSQGRETGTLRRKFRNSSNSLYFSIYIYISDFSRFPLDMGLGGFFAFFM